VLGRCTSAETSITYWYEPATNLICYAPKMIESRNYAGLCVVKDHFVFAIGGVKLYGCSGYTGNSIISVEMLDVSSSSLCWVSKADMLVNRNCFGIGVLNNCIYAVSNANILVILCYKLINNIYFILY